MVNSSLLTQELREQMVLELAEFSAQKGWDPSLTLLIACDLANVLIANLPKSHGSEAFEEAVNSAMDEIGKLVEEHYALPIVKVVALSNMLSQLIIHLAKENANEQLS